MSDEIDLEGKLSEISLRSSSSGVQAFKETTSIILIPMINLNNVIVRIIDCSGNTVFTSNYNLRVNSKISIETFSWDKGEYTLYIVTAEGNYLSGSFYN